MLPHFPFRFLLFFKIFPCRLFVIFFFGSILVLCSSAFFNPLSSLSFTQFFLSLHLSSLITPGFLPILTFNYPTFLCLISFLIKCYFCSFHSHIFISQMLLLFLSLSYFYSLTKLILCCYIFPLFVYHNILFTFLFSILLHPNIFFFTLPLFLLLFPIMSYSVHVL